MGFICFAVKSPEGLQWGRKVFPVGEKLTSNLKIRVFYYRKVYKTGAAAVLYARGYTISRHDV